MDLLDACAYHQLALGADGRSVATQKLYMTYQRAFLDYLNARRIPPTLDALNPLNMRNATDWFRADRATGAARRGDRLRRPGGRCRAGRPVGGAQPGVDRR